MRYDSASILQGADAQPATHYQILQRMLARLREPGAGPLAALTVRDSADPALALLDAWAMVGDLIGFYQERIAAESYLRSAAERRSLLELVRALGYELRPGLAASVSLAFNVQVGPATGPTIPISAGVQVQSVPGPGQVAQTFETTEPLMARPEWNLLAPALPEVELPPAVTSTSLQVRGTGLQLRSGDLVLLELGGSAPVARRLEAVEPDPGGAFTTLRWREAVTLPRGRIPRLHTLRWRGGLFGRTAPPWDGTSPEQRPPDMRLRIAGAATGWADPAGSLPRYPINGIAALRQGDATTLFLASAGGGVFRSTDGGVTWSAVNAGLRELSLFAIATDPQGRLWAGGADGAIYRSSDGGASWGQISAGSVIETTRELFYRESDLEVRNGVTRPKDGSRPVDRGVPKTTVHGDGLPRAPINALLCLKDRSYAATGAGAFVSSDDGRTWAPLNSLTMVRALATDAQGAVVLAALPDGLRVLAPEAAPADGSAIANSPAGTRALAIDGESLYIAAGAVLARGKLSNNNWQQSMALEAGGSVRALAGAGGQIFAIVETAPTSDWPGLRLAADDRTLDLDGRYDELAGEPWAVLVDHGGPATPAVVALDQVRAEQVSGFASSGVVTRLQLKSRLPAAIIGASRRTVEVLSGGAELPLYRERRLLTGPLNLANPDEQLQIVVAGPAPVLEPGRRLVITGRYTDEQGILRSGGDEVRVLSCAATPEGLRIALERPGLSRPYLRESLRVYGNVALATHGETIHDEVLGSGDGSLTNQRFTLTYAPLTYVSAATASGARSTLEVRVNEVLWREAPTLYGLGPRDQGYITRRDDAGRTTVIFGDGVCGARLPSGSENVRATYRYGLGLAGLVAAATLTLPLSRPLGVQEVTNPLPATGADDPEGLARARVAAPTALQTLERVVSLSDFEHFARSFAGIAMAQADLVATPAGAIIYLTVAGSGGVALGPGSPLLNDLHAAIDARRNPNQTLVIAPYQPQLFALSALLYRDPRYPPGGVPAAARAALLAAFGFGSRAFGESVTATQIIAVLQQTPGVVAATIQALSIGPPVHALRPPALLRAARARWSAGVLAPAQLLVIDPAALTLVEEEAR